MSTTYFTITKTYKIETPKNERNPTIESLITKYHNQKLDENFDNIIYSHSSKIKKI